MKRLFVAGLILTAWFTYEAAYDSVFRPVNCTERMLELPLTGWSFYRAAYSTVHAIPPLEKIAAAWYTVGFTTMIAAALLWFVLTRRPEELDAGLAGMAVIHGTVMVIYAIAFVYPPHMVFGFNPVRSPIMNLANNHFVCPSLHTTLAVFFALYFAWKEKNKIVKALFVANGLIVPTVTILFVQHWIYDAVSGVILAGTVFYAVKRWERKIRDAMDRWNPPEKATAVATVIIYLLNAGYALGKALGMLP